jgi:hypothetical protein
MILGPDGGSVCDVMMDVVAPLVGLKEYCNLDGQSSKQRKVFKGRSQLEEGATFARL